MANHSGCGGGGDGGWILLFVVDGWMDVDCATRRRRSESA